MSQSASVPSSILDSFKDPALCRAVLEQLKAELDSPLRFMEVCGTHTVAIFRSGIHSLLPGEVVHISGPGCPVCVTHDAEVALFLELAAKPGVVVATFGDLMRVPGPQGGSLKSAQAEGGRVQIVYSPMDALKLAKDHPGDTVVFLGVGFETTAPTVAATVKMARAAGVANFKVLSFHKLVPPALRALLADPDTALDALILPGHVSAIIGMDAYRFIAEEYKTPAAITGFEPLDILQSLLEVAKQKREGRAEIANLYTRVVPPQGNPKARAILDEVFRPADALWRGIGTIPGSGLAFTDAYADYDAMACLGLALKDVKPLPGCRCGEVLKGKMKPNDCPLFAKACTPASPVGPCMVSSEGSCAAYFKFQLEL